MKDKYTSMGIKAFSYPISDTNENVYLDGLYHASQHLNDLITEQGHTVFLHDNTGISRAPTLILAYLCLYARIRTYSNLPEASKMLTNQASTAMPNIKAVGKFLRRFGAFQERQIALLSGDFYEDDKLLNEITPNYYGEDRQNPVRVYMADMVE